MGLFAIWVEQHAKFLPFLPRTVRRESNLPKLKVDLTQKVEGNFQIAQNECRENYPGIEKKKSLIFLHLQI